MQRCYADPFNSSAAYKQSSPARGRKYFEISDELPEKYRSIINLLWNAVPKLLNSSLSQKISLIKTENELATHLKQFKKAIPQGQAGKFSCFVFDSSCTFLSVMHYGNPNATKRHHELCLYSGKIHLPRPQSLREFYIPYNNLNPSRFISETSTDLYDAEEISSSDDELIDSFEMESLEPYQESDYEYEKNMTVRDKDGYNFVISILPSLKDLRNLRISGEKIEPQYHAQVCGMSDGPNEAIQILFQAIYGSLLSGYHDE